VRLSILIVNWNTTELLGDCLRSIAKYPPSADYEIVVVDNASGDFREPEFAAEFPNVRLIANAENAGYAKGNNQAIEASTGDFVLLLNPDTEVTDGAIEALLDFMDRQPDAAAVGAKLVRPSGEIDRSVRGFPYPGSIAAEFLGLSRLFPKSKALGAYRMTSFAYNEEAEVDQPMGSCLMLSAKAIDEVGLFDEQFPIFFNEVDWLYWARQKGYKVYFTPKAVVVHHGGAGTSQANRRRMIHESHDSLVRFYEKHFRGSLWPPIYHFTVACIRLGRLLRS